MKPGDLVVTRDMGLASGKIGLIISLQEYKFHEDKNVLDYILYDVILDSELIEGMHDSFLQLLEDKNV